MSVATVSSKGQITLPAAARRALGIEAGDRILLRVRDRSIVIELAPDFLAMKGVAGPALPPSREREAAEQEAAGRVTERE